MPHTHQLRAATLQGIAFSIEDLLLVRSWAARQNLSLRIATDQVINQAEFEEMLILAPLGHARRSLTIWRTKRAVVAQAPHSFPRAYSTVQNLLWSMGQAARPRPAWRRLLGWVA